MRRIDYEEVFVFVVCEMRVGSGVHGDWIQEPNYGDIV